MRGLLKHSVSGWRGRRTVVRWRTSSVAGLILAIIAVPAAGQAQRTAPWPSPEVIPAPQPSSAATGTAGQRQAPVVTGANREAPKGPVQHPNIRTAPRKAPAVDDAKRLPLPELQPWDSSIVVRSTASPLVEQHSVYFVSNREFQPQGVLDFVPKPRISRTLTTGHCRITLPRTWQPGDSVEPKRAPAAVDEPGYLRISLVQGQSQFWSGIEQELSLTATRTKTDRRPLLFLVHGFNTTFEDACRRAVLISRNVGWTGPTVMFSWPSHGGGVNGLLRYGDDDSVARASGRDVAAVLARLVNATQASEVHVIAHSMGSLPLIEGLGALHNKTFVDNAGLAPSEVDGLRQRLASLILAAPDYDLELFGRFIRTEDTTKVSVVVYGASNDGALEYSKQIRPANERLGLFGASGPPIIDGVHMIDVTAVNVVSAAERAIGGGHDYHVRVPVVMRDIKAWLARTPPEARPWLQASEQTAGHWRIVVYRGP